MKQHLIFPFLLSLALLLSACYPSALQSPLVETQASRDPTEIIGVELVNTATGMPTLASTGTESLNGEPAPTSSLEVTRAPTASSAVVPQKAISWSEFGRTIHLVYDPTLAPNVEASSVPEVPYSPSIMYPDSHPAYAAFRFTGYQKGKPFQLPYPMQDAQVMIFQTRDFPGFSSDVPRNFNSQQQALSKLLEQELDPERCEHPLVGYDQSLPFLPWLNARQMFCSQPKVIDFQSGKGIRYLTHFTQDDGPVLESMLFYTFQGLSDDGKLCISAVFPVQAGVFPTQPADCPKCSDPSYDPRPDWQATLAEQLIYLNNLPEDQFSPSLSVLDAMLRSIQFEAQ